MMAFQTFDQVEEYVLKQGICKTVALCGAHDEPALSALVEAKRKGIVKGILIGKEEEIRQILTQLGEDPKDYEIIDEPEETLSAKLVVAKVRQGSADITMKGLMQTVSYMRAILNKETGILPPGKVLSETSVIEYPEQERLLFVTDCGINITPDVPAKVQIIHNAVALAKVFGLTDVKVACLSALENVNPKIPSTAEADDLAHMDWDDCTVEGPFALDNAVSEEAASHKGISGKVAGKADVLVVPDLCVGNVLHKSINYFAHNKIAGAVCGTDYPVIITSRADSPNTKYNSILAAVLQSL